MEVEGVASMAGNATRELISKLGMKSLSKGVKVECAGRDRNGIPGIEPELWLQHQRHHF